MWITGGLYWYDDRSAEGFTRNAMVLRLRQEKAISIGRSALAVWLGKRGWTFKKRPHTHVLEQERPDLCKQRRDWFDA